jgi:hypothetical protein
MTDSIEIDKHRVPASRRDDRLFLSLHYADARPLITWDDAGPHPYAMRALFYSKQGIRIRMQFIGVSHPVTDILVPDIPDHIPEGLHLMGHSIMSRADEIFETKTRVRIANFGMAQRLSYDQAKSITPEVETGMSDLLEVEVALSRYTPLPPKPSGHKLIQIQSLPEVEYYRSLERS